MALAPADSKSRFIQGEFVPKNPEKYIGNSTITFRSSWEHKVMTTLDNHPCVLQWSSESIAIPYRNPFTGTTHRYYPDFFIVYVDSKGNKHGEIIEIKPAAQTLQEMASSKRDLAQIALNTYKWDAAERWCLKRGIKFRVITEMQLFEQSVRRIGGKIRNKSSAARAKKAYFTSKKRTSSAVRTRTTKKRR
jgi:hypothetical protein